MRTIIHPIQLKTVTLLAVFFWCNKYGELLFKQYCKNSNKNVCTLTEPIKMSPKMSLKCPPITRFRQIWPTYNVFNSITSAVRTLLSVGLPKPFLGSGEIVRRKTHLLTKIFFILIYDRISEFVLWLFVNRCVSSCLSKKNCWPNALLRQARQKKSQESFLYASSSDRYALRISQSPDGMGGWAMI